MSQTLFPFTKKKSPFEEALYLGFGCQSKDKLLCTLYLRNCDQNFLQWMNLTSTLQETLLQIAELQ